MLEAEYQAKLIKKLKAKFPGCIILKNDAAYLQGMLDLTILYQDMWAALEVKAAPGSPLRPNQKHYVREMDEMSFAAIIFPQNEEEVLVALEEAFASKRRACIPQP
jgi:hypothetical protein